MIKRIAVIILIIVAMIFNSNLKREIVDELNLVMGVGFDDGENGAIEGTALISVFESPSETKNVLITTTGKITWDVLTNLQRQSKEPLVIGSLKVIGIGKNLAQKGINEYMDAISREPSVGGRIHLFVAEENVKEIFKGNYSKLGTGRYLLELLEQNQTLQDIPYSNFHVFLNDYYEIGKDPFLPILGKKYESKVEVKGIGLFKKDQLVDTLKPKEMFSFKLLVGKHQEGSQLTKVGKYYADIKSISSRHKIILKSPSEMEILIKINGIIREYSGNTINDKSLKKIRDSFNEQLTKECENLIQRFQELNIDPVGFGSYMRSVDRNFTIEKWQEKYPTMKFHVKIDTTLLEWGVWD